MIATRLGQSFENEDFWSTAILFFANNPMLDPAHVGPIVDFIHDQKYVLQQIARPGGGFEQRPPAQPNFSLKSRSIPKLLRQVDEWHEALARQVLLPDAEDEPDRAGGKKIRVRHISWGASSIGEFELKQEDKQLGETLTWSVKELLSNHELGAEGREMGHCVYTYAKSCRNGSTSIWSLGVENGKGHRHRILTIAVDPRSRTITQIRGRFNALPNAKNKKNSRLPEDAAPLAQRARAVDEPRIYHQDGKGHRHRVLTIATVDPRSRTFYGTAPKKTSRRTPRKARSLCVPFASETTYARCLSDRFNALPNAKNKKNLERAYQKIGGGFLLRSHNVLGQWMSR